MIIYSARCYPGGDDTRRETLYGAWYLSGCNYNFKSWAISKQFPIYLRLATDGKSCLNSGGGNVRDRWWAGLLSMMFLAYFEILHYSQLQTRKKRKKPQAWEMCDICL